ncbi:DoxX-like family protein [Pseudomonas capsici]|uniref:DoxX-like family protein n=1 Tax=Pseudomonas capsici TaxID=2810614 RepID=A0ABT3BZ52_9PSED|nr:DoxX-like family protein [Pseudomonas capsici]MBX8476866.1 DoxX-like family protein [Pseudomonas cichorii]MBN6715901.1 DoxX-like family protein [Pseudomonas capsici]MBN6720847.1 DoxX-like family protein [Pseudomonas capsici]MBN6725803.1 DoxX-like family protein [Pseudomonas capsici]MCV4270407.1 DoxX-like family protein [Pseudomonas capsici]
MSELQRIAWVARAGLALMFFYHGLVPKILWLSPGELEMIQAHGFADASRVAWLSGAAEIGLAICLISGYFKRTSLMLSAVVLAGLLIDVALVSPHFLAQAFNPVSLNGAGLALCAVAWLAERPQRKLAG